MAGAKPSVSDYSVDSLYIKDTVNLLIARKDEISIRFSVQINLEKPDQSMDDGCWVNIDGPGDKVALAKTYIKCLCAPEDVSRMQYPGDLHGYLSDKQNVFSLERQYKVIVECNDGENEDDPGEVQIRGDELNVALALSAIEDLIASYTAQNDRTVGDSTDTSSYQHSYSDQTSSKLNSSLMGISKKIQLEKEEVSKYPDVMKKLILSWVTESPENEETIDIDSDSDDRDQTLTSTSTSLPVTSTPLVPQPSSSHVKIEMLSNTPGPSGLRSSRSDGSGPSGPGISGLRNRHKPGTLDQGKVYVDLTDSSSSERCVSRIDIGSSDTSDDEDDSTIRTVYPPTPQPRQSLTRHMLPSHYPVTSQSEPPAASQPPVTLQIRQPNSLSPKTSGASGDPSRQDSPTTQISTITLDDESSSSKSKLSVPSYDEIVSRLAGVGKTRGYNEIEIAQALSLCGESPEEREFFSLLNKVRRSESGSPVSDPPTVTKMGIPEPKGTPRKKKKNAALDSINKRQQTLSPNTVSAMPTEKRVKTQPSSNGDTRRALIEPPAVVSITPVVRPQPPLAGTSYSGEPQSKLLSTATQLLDDLKQRNLPSESQQRQNTPPQSQLAQIRAQQSSKYHTTVNNPEPVAHSSSHYPPQPRYAAPQTSGLPQPPAGFPHGLFADPYRAQSVHTSNSQAYLMNADVQPAPPLPAAVPFLPPLPMPPALPTRRAVPQTRMVVLDGSNIAFGHGKKYYGSEKVFSAEGILLAINFLREKYGATHENLKAIVPTFRCRDKMTRDGHLLEQMEKSGFLNFSPCKTMPNGKKIVPYDDRFILDLAVATDGVVISNDKYADLITEQNRKYADVINNRVIMFMFIGDTFMIPEDPMGRSGPTLDQLLRPKTLTQNAPQSSRNTFQTGYSHPSKVPDNQLYTGSNRYSTLGILPNDRDYTAAHHQTARASLRNAAESSLLMANLLELFPGKSPQIKGLLARHPYEKELEVFVDHMV